MSLNSEIEWCDTTWNPTLGCSKVSPGCKNCYAMRVVHRLAGNPHPAVKAANAGLTVINGCGPNWTGKVRLIEERLSEPLHWKKPRRVFVNSLSDLFHEGIDDYDIDRVFAVMALAKEHTFQVLTKRAERLPLWYAGFTAPGAFHRGGACGWWLSKLEELGALPGGSAEVVASSHMPRLPNVWLGVSVESREYLPRIDHLRRTPAAVRFLSLEPLLEDLGDISGYLRPHGHECHCGCGYNSERPGIDWVVVGGESGPGARPMHPAWVRSIRDQCLAARVPFFFKQWGGWQDGSTLGARPKLEAVVLKDGRYQRYADDFDQETKNRWPSMRPVAMARVGKREAGRVLDGRTWDEMPEVKR